MARCLNQAVGPVLGSAKMAKNQTELDFGNTIDNLPTVSYHHEGVHEMSDKDHVWMNSPKKAETTEYIPEQPHATLGGDDCKGNWRLDLAKSSRRS